MPNETEDGIPAWSLNSNISWRIRFSNPLVDDIVVDGTTVSQLPNNDGLVGTLVADIDATQFPEGKEVQYEVSLVAIANTVEDFDAIAKPDAIYVNITRCKCESEMYQGNVRQRCRISIWSPPLGQSLNPSLSYSSFDCSSLPSSLGYGWTSVESARMFENPNGNLHYRDTSGRFHAWKLDNGNYKPMYADNKLEVSVDPLSTDKRYTVRSRDGMQRHFDEDGKIFADEDTNENLTTYSHASTFFSASDESGRTTYYHRTLAEPQPYLISDKPDPQDPDARKYELEYWDSSAPAPGRLKSLKNPVDDVLEFYYNEDGLLIEERELKPTIGNRSTFYNYFGQDEKNAGRLRLKTVPNEYQQVFNYGVPIGPDLGNLVFTQDLSPGNNTPNRYVYNVLDSFGRLTKVYELNGSEPSPNYNVTTTVYNDPTAPLPNPLPSDPNDIQESDDPYLPVKTIDPRGFITEYFYTPRGNVKKMIDAEGNSTVYKYAEQDSMSNIHGDFPDYVLEIHRSPVTVNGVLETYPPTKFTYETGTGNLLSVEDAAGKTSSFQYNNDGQVTLATDRLGFKTRFEYDPVTANLLKVGVQKTLDPMDDDIVTDFRYIEYTYDDYDNVETVKDPINPASHSLYDNLDRLTKLTDPSGAVTDFDYADWVLTLTKLPANTGSVSSQREMKPTYDTAGRVVAMERETASTVFEKRYGQKYDGFSQVTALERTKNGNPEEYKTEYDILGRPVKSVDTLQNESTIAYEPFCSTSATTSARGVRIRTERDKLCRVKRIEAGRPDPNDPLSVLSPTEIRLMEYDELGRLVETTQQIYPTYGSAIYSDDKYGQPREDVRSFEYDNRDRLVKVTFEDGKEASYEYDFEGRVIKMTENASSATPVVTDYTYYGDGLLHTVTFRRAGGDMVFTYSYDAAGRLASVTYPPTTGIVAYFDDGATPTPNSGWDENGRLTHLRYEQGGSEIRRYEYAYDPSGNRKIHKDIPATGDAKLWVYKHDWLDRLTSVSLHMDANPLNLDENLAVLQSVYVFDASDNREYFDDYTDGANGKTYHYIYKSVTDGASTHYSDQLKEIRVYDTSAGHRNNGDFTLLESFEHDDDGNMISRTLGATTTNYHWDRFNKLLKLTTSDNSKKQSHLYGMNGFRRKKKDINNVETTEYATDLETMAAKNSSDTITYLMGHQLLGFEKNGALKFFLTDGLSTVREVVGYNSGTTEWEIQASYEFSAYGQKISPANTGGVESLKTYVGGLSVQDEVEETSLMLMGQRFYDPSLGRFLNRDPIGFDGGLNLFSYGANNPVTMVDPAGLAPPAVESRPIPNGSITVEIQWMPADITAATVNYRGHATLVHKGIKESSSTYTGTRLPNSVIRFNVDITNNAPVYNTIWVRFTVVEENSEMTAGERDKVDPCKPTLKGLVGRGKVKVGLPPGAPPIKNQLVEIPVPADYFHGDYRVWVRIDSKLPKTVFIDGIEYFTSPGHNTDNFLVPFNHEGLRIVK